MTIKDIKLEFGLDARVLNIFIRFTSHMALNVIDQFWTFLIIHHGISCLCLILKNKLLNGSLFCELGTHLKRSVLSVFICAHLLYLGHIILNRHYRRWFDVSIVRINLLLMNRWVIAFKYYWSNFWSAIFWKFIWRVKSCAFRVWILLMSFFFNAIRNIYIFGIRLSRNRRRKLG